ncbi:hypothetical protein WJX74_000605 [Apatococcus lobatus]|uniref:Uncharacterized protein n=1 Tax=Apatococcus lobatus TaxID=904363 RepID=A0AAW1RW57_9CHLO
MVATISATQLRPVCSTQQAVRAVPRTNATAQTGKQNVLSKLSLLGAAAAATLTLASPALAGQADFGGVLPKDTPKDDVSQQKLLGITVGDTKGADYKANKEGPAGSIFAGDRSKEGQVKPSKAEKKDRLGEFQQSLQDSGDKNEPAEFQS